MAKNKSTVFLGYEDEEITLKHTALLNSTVNKIGGTPDWPCGDIKVPACQLCGTQRPLIVQLYAPLEHSQFHRTLYIFACLNPTCSQNSKSWLCIRTQHLDMPIQADLINALPQGNGGKAHKKKKNAKQPSNPKKINWCSGADDWGDDSGADCVEDMDTEADEDIEQTQEQQENEENGNVIIKNDNSPIRERPGASLNNSDEEDDDEDESTSMENDLICGFAQIDMNSPQNAAAANTNDPNANCAAAVAGSIDGNTTSSCYAEIEGGENDIVLVETPKKPERDLIALLKQTTTPAAIGPLSKITDVTIKGFFIAVDIEQRQRISGNNYEQYSGNLSDDHIRELYQEYKRQDEAAHTPNSVAMPGSTAVASGSAGDEQESYEKSLPAHGDLIFHQFLNVLQQNPGQIIRYSRDTLPLLITPLVESVPKCPNCNGETICEIQVLSTLIPKLFLQQNSEPAPIEFGNVLVFTCLKSCWDTPDKMRFERVIVQAEK